MTTALSAPNAPDGYKTVTTTSTSANCRQAAIIDGFPGRATQSRTLRIVPCAAQGVETRAPCQRIGSSSSIRRMYSLPFQFIHWAPDPVMFTLGQRQYRWYAVLFVAGLLGGYAIAVLTFLRERVDIAYANILLVFVAIGAVVGARLGEVFFYEWPYFRAHPEEIFQIWRGGLASHGAVIGIPLMLWLYARVVVGKPFLWVLDRTVPGIALAASCVRIGNLMN